MSWPALRDELELLPGPVLDDGQPSWTLHDPVRQLFFRIDWPTFEILQRWGQGSQADVAQQICEATTLQVDANDVTHVAQFLTQHQLIRPQGPEDLARMTQTWHKQQGTWWSWLMHHYLFFRIPLWRPDAWLNRWLPVANWFVTPAFRYLSGFALALGLWQLARQWDTFTHALVDTFNWSGLMAYGLAIVGVKFVHELGHAFSAKRQGCRVPTMGLAFLVMWPVAYTDTNEAWRLTQRWGRLRIASAGIATELCIGIWALLAWGWLPDGAWRSAALVLATSSLVATLAVNASPFMRFDGYFIVSDLLDMPNLHERSFALARWHLRKVLFGLNDPVPETFSPRRHRGLILFAWATWLYRLVLFLGIAVLVYHFFIKAVGLVLFAIEMIWFIARPIYQEIAVWRDKWPSILQSTRTRQTAIVLALLLTTLIVPWPTRISATAMLRPVDTWPVFAPVGAQLIGAPHANGKIVKAGEPLFTLQAPDLTMRQQAAQARIERLQWQSSAAPFDDNARTQWLVQQEQLRTAQAELAALEAEAAQLQPRAPYAGILQDVSPDLQTGQWVGRKERLAVLVRQDSDWQIETWLSEADVQRLQLGQTGHFTLPMQPLKTLSAKISAIEKDASRTLPRAELAVPHGGHIVVREKDRQLYPEQAVYRVVLKVPHQAVAEAALTEHTWRGQLTLEGSWESPAWPYLRQATAVLIRELSF